MTMLVDRRKDNYDELLMVAGDSRANRARTNRWTTGLIVGAMAATGAYVATVSQQVDSLRATTDEARGTARDATEQGGTIRAEYAKLLDERLALQGENSELRRSLAYYARTMPSTPRPTDVLKTELSNVVWMVDGSRRFPMTDEDILWVPEGGFWIRLKTETTGQNETNKVNTLFRHDTKLGARNSPGTALVLPYSTTVPPRGTANCIEINLHELSIRPGFENSNYVDIEVLFTNNPNCPP